MEGTNAEGEKGTMTMPPCQLAEAVLWFENGSEHNFNTMKFTFHDKGDEKSVVEKSIVSPLR